VACACSASALSLEQRPSSLACLIHGYIMGGFDQAQSKINKQINKSREISKTKIFNSYAHSAA
jgi:hypothetical protein